MDAPKPPTPAALARAAGRPKPPPPPASPAATTDEVAPVVDETEAAIWGRVADDGTVFVRDAAGAEREVGQYAVGSPDGAPHEALAFFVRRYASIAAEVELLDRRVRAGSLSPDEATASVTSVREQLVDANAVGNLAGLTARLDDLGPVIDAQRESRRAERAKRTEEARARKEQLVGEAERLGQGRDWRNGANRLRDLLEEWKALPRLDRASDDELWHRFSAARTAYTRSRKQHFSALDEKHGDAKAVKERLITEAEALSASTEWGPTSGKYRDLMTRWKEAGPASRHDDDALWKRFRTAQDIFFGARDAANSAQDAEFATNADAKDAILLEAKALLPDLKNGSKNLDAAKRAYRDIAERWESAGKVPRDRMKDLEAGIRQVEQAIRKAEDDQWSSSDPEKTARADDMVGKLEKAVADLEKQLAAAQAAGDPGKAKKLESDLEGRRSFLEMARRTASELG